MVKAARDNNIDHSHPVKRGFLAFCTLVVVPCAIASGAAARAADDAWEELAHVSAARIARLALSTLEQDLGAAVDSLLGSADPIPSPDTTIEAVRLALAGDTVSALDPTASGVEVVRQRRTGEFALDDAPSDIVLERLRRHDHFVALGGGVALDAPAHEQQDQNRPPGTDQEHRAQHRRPTCRPANVSRS